MSSRRDQGPWERGDWDLPAGWEAVHSARHDRCFFQNTLTGQVTWDLPDGASMEPPMSMQALWNRASLQ